MASFLTTVKSAFSRELSGHLAARLGESEKGVANALEGIVPVVLGGLINKTRLEGECAVFELSHRAFRTTGRTFGTVTGMLGILGSGNAADSAMTRGEILLGTLLGSPGRTLAGLIASQAGIRHDSARTLLNLVAAALPALLGQYAQNYQLKASGLAAAMLGLKGPVRAMRPNGLHGLTGDGVGTRAAWPGAPVSRATEAVRRGLLAIIGAGARWYSGAVAMAALALLAVCATRQPTGLGAAPAVGHLLRLRLNPAAADGRG